MKPEKLAYYGYLGLIIGFFGYTYLYAGNWDYYYSGDWQKEDQLATLFNPGFNLTGQAIAIPKLIAAPLTLTVATVIIYLICTLAEKAYKSHLQQNKKHLSEEQILHHVFSVVTFVAFNVFFMFGWRPLLNQLPQAMLVQQVFTLLVFLVSFLWLRCTLNRSDEKYLVESLAKQLNKSRLECSEFLQGRCLKELKPNEFNWILVKGLEDFPQYQLQVYKGALEEGLEEKHFDSGNSLEELKQMRKKLNLNDQVHHTILFKIQRDKPYLVKEVQADTTLAKTIRRSGKPTQDNRTQVRRKEN